MASNLMNLAADVLRGRGAMAAYYLGEDNPTNRRRITALMHEVAIEHRIPFYLEGGQPCSRKSWLDEFTEQQRRLAAEAAAAKYAADRAEDEASDDPTPIIDRPKLGRPRRGRGRPRKTTFEERLRV